MLTLIHAILTLFSGLQAPLYEDGASNTIIAIAWYDGVETTAL